MDQIALLIFILSIILLFTISVVVALILKHSDGKVLDSTWMNKVLGVNGGNAPLPKHYEIFSFNGLNVKKII